MTDDELERFAREVRERVSLARQKVMAGGHGYEPRVPVMAPINDLNRLREKLTPEEWYALDLCTPEEYEVRSWRSLWRGVKELLA